MCLGRPVFREGVSAREGAPIGGDAPFWLPTLRFALAVR